MKTNFNSDMIQLRPIRAPDRFNDRSATPWLELDETPLEPPQEVTVAELQPEDY